jgi:signal transduction histidine kinase
MIFRPFFTTKSRGNGLGLTISRKIVEQHHGSIAIGNRPGGGTVCTIVLPHERSVPHES